MEQDKSPVPEDKPQDQQAGLIPGYRCEESHTPDGVFFRHWKQERPLFVMLLAHGLGEHSGRYEHVASALGRAGATTLAPDHVGHGRSPGHRCYIDKFETYFDTLDYLREKASVEYPDLPCFIVGHSLGGLIVSNYLIERKPSLSGAVFSGAAFQVPQPPSKLTLFISKILSMIAPRMGVMQLDASEVSRDPQVVATYVADPLVHSGKISAGLAVQLFAALAGNEEKSQEINLPILVLHGEGDVMTAPAGSQRFHDQVSSSDKTLKFYPALYHEIFNEPEKAEVLSDVCAWIQQRLPNA